jgi:PAS domain S-box-containing protein
MDTQQLRRIVNEPEFFQLIFDAVPLLVVVKSMVPESFGRFLLWNRVATEWLGLHPEEVLGRTDFDFFPHEQAAFFQQMDREVMKSGRMQEIPNEPIQSRDGEMRFMRTTKTPIFDDQGRPLALLAVSENITESKRTAAELEATMQRLRNERNLFHALLDHLPVCAFAKSAREQDFGTYVLWNRVMEELHGTRAQDALGRTLADTFDPATAKVLAEQDRQVIEKGSVLDIPLQSINYGRAGLRLMHTVNAPVYDANGAPLAVIGIAEDITERVHAEAERMQMMEMLRQLNSHVPGALYQLKLDAEGQRSFSYVSERIAEIYGIPASEFLADYAMASGCVFEEDRAVVEEAQAISRRDGTPFQCEFRILRRDGAQRWVQSSAVPQRVGDTFYWHGFIMDVTERRLADEALRESEERWQLALAGSEAGVWDWNIRTGEMFYSERWRQMFGSDVPANAQQLLHLIHPEDREFVRRRTLELLRGKAELFRCEYRMAGCNGGYIWILAHAKAHFDDAGRPTRMIGTLIDISDRKKVEAELLEAKDAAEGANRAKSDFLAMMSHEIRTPLNGVLGFAELLAGTSLEPGQREYVHIIRESGSNLLHVLNDILDYSKIESGRLAIDNQPTVLRELVETAVETFRAKAATKKLRLESVVAPGTPGVVMADALRLQQVLMNLVSNAVKFTSAGFVRLCVEATGAADREGRVPVRFTVEDTGIGISGDDLPRLFEPFEQLDLSMARRFGGTGLGLSIVHRIVRMMDGRVTASSAPGLGSTFVVDFLLPVVAQNEPKSAPMELCEPEKPQSAKQASILLVEDNAVNRRLARLMLERLGYSPDEAEDGSVAVALASERNYDVVLMDIQMPGMDGYEAARLIHAQLPTAQIIALTAHAMPADRARSHASGMCEHLSKPVRIEELRAALEGCAQRASQAEAAF